VCIGVAMFGGDDVGAVVLEHGSTYTKIGYAGESQPRALLHSVSTHTLL
jgi:actin-related protein